MRRDNLASDLPSRLLPSGIGHNVLIPSISSPSSSPCRAWGATTSPPSAPPPPPCLPPLAQGIGRDDLTSDGQLAFWYTRYMLRQAHTQQQAQQQQLDIPLFLQAHADTILTTGEKEQDWRNGQICTLGGGGGGQAADGRNGQCTLGRGGDKQRMGGIVRIGGLWASLS